jgi:MSHA pilin protein MshD
MSSGHMLLSMGAMMLLSTILLRLNSNILNTTSTLDETKFGILATSLGTSIIEEANSKAFDLVTDGDAVSDVNSLTDPNGLGPASGEVYPFFNDFDDFNGLSKIISTMPSAVFKESCAVHYVSAMDPSIIVNTKTWHKRIDVFITSPSIRDTVKLSSVCSYWYFR